MIRIIARYLQGRSRQSCGLHSLSASLHLAFFSLLQVIPTIKSIEYLVLQRESSRLAAFTGTRHEVRGMKYDTGKRCQLARSLSLLLALEMISSLQLKLTDTVVVWRIKKRPRYYSPCRNIHTHTHTVAPLPGIECTQWHSSQG